MFVCLFFWQIVASLKYTQLLKHWFQVTNQKSEPSSFRTLLCMLALASLSVLYFTLYRVFLYLLSYWIIVTTLRSRCFQGPDNSTTVCRASPPKVTVFTLPPALPLDIGEPREKAGAYTRSEEQDVHAWNMHLGALTRLDADRRMPCSSQAHQNISAQDCIGCISQPRPS